MTQTEKLALCLVIVTLCLQRDRGFAPANHDIGEFHCLAFQPQKSPCFHRPLPKRGCDTERGQIHSPSVQDRDLMADRLKLSEMQQPSPMSFALISQEADCRQRRSCGDTGPVCITCMEANTPAEISLAQANRHKTISGAVSRPICDEVDFVDSVP